MDSAVKEGLRVHFVRKDSTPTGDIELGNSYTALCGVEWMPTITDPDKLSELPLCYECVAWWAGRLYLKWGSEANPDDLADYLLFKSILDEADNDSDD